MLARFGDEILTADVLGQHDSKGSLSRPASQRNRMISWSTVFGDQAAEDEIENKEDLVGNLFAYFVSFTTDAANTTVRDSGEGNGLEAWRRPDVVHETRGDSAASPDPTALSTCRRSGSCSGRLALEETSVRDVHRQERTTLPDIRRQPCGGHVSADAKEPGGDCYVRQRGRGLPGDVRQTAGLQQHEAVDTNEREQDNEENDPMDVDALSKG